MASLKVSTGEGFLHELENLTLWRCSSTRKTQPISVEFLASMENPALWRFRKIRKNQPIIFRSATGKPTSVALWAILENSTDRLSFEPRSNPTPDQVIEPAHPNGKID